MSRHPISGTCRDQDSGQVRGSTTISVFLSGTSTPASIYTTSTGGTAVGSVTSDVYGRFLFYIDEADYSLTQLFKIVVSKTGFDDITYDTLSLYSLQCLDTDNTLSSNSDKKIPTQKAVKGYVDSRTPTVVASPTAENDFIVSNSSLLWIKKSLSEILTILGITGIVSDTAYDATSWNGVTGVAPSKNAIRDMIEAKIVFKLLPTGVVLPYGKSTAPDGWLICNGAAYSRETYADLFAIIGTTFGSGDGSTTFNVPNLLDRVPVGSGSTYSLAATGGAATHTLSISEMPYHNHSIPIAGNQGLTMSGGGSSGHASSTTGYAGGDSAHNNMQPYIALNYIIKY